jgi:predicted nicotinamide N-methyase
MAGSILAAKMGARLTIATDKTEMLPLLRHNARTNNLVVAGGNLPLLDPMPARGQAGGVLVGMPLPWGCSDSLQEVRAELQKAQAGGGVEDGLDDERSTYPDVILGSDLVYGQPEQVLRKLLSTLVGLSHEGRTTVLLAHKHRRDSPCASMSDRCASYCRWAASTRNLQQGPAILHHIRLASAARTVMITLFAIASAARTVMITLFAIPSYRGLNLNIISFTVST